MTATPRSIRQLFMHIACVGSLALLPLSGSFAETFFKWQDETGTWVYGAHPPAGVEAIEVKTTIGRASAAKEEENSDQEDEEEAANEDKEGQLYVETRPQIPEEKRQQLCTQARGNLEALSSKAVIRQRDAEGNLVELSEEGREKEADKARMAIDEYC